MEGDEKRQEPSGAGGSHREAERGERSPGESFSRASTRGPRGGFERRLIGRYELLEVIGEGGFGTVYLAEQKSPVRRRVALKVLRVGVGGGQEAARFEAEQQALALMDHPNIAKVFDAGVTDEGQPYFVMEYVPGVSLSEYCTRHQVDLRGRLELVIKVCRALEHAHQKGIIHRDLKPANILVATEGNGPQPKVIDFGVAKALTRRLTDRTLHTERGQLIGTLEYMSPEQAELSPQGIDTRSDIYSLGIVLYELMTGTLPFDAEALREGGLSEFYRIIHEVEPPKPSTRLGSLGGAEAPGAPPGLPDRKLLVRELRGDLDWIVMKALAKERDRRYPSAGALAADIERHLHHQAVLARPPSVAYRMGKFVRRHRLGVAAAAMVLIALVAGLAAASAGFLRARREAAKALAISDFLETMLSSVNPESAGGPEVTVKEVLDRAARNARVSFRGQPEVRAAIQRTLGTSYLALADHDAAAEQLEAALSWCRGEYGEDDPRTARALSAVALLRSRQGRAAEAERLGREALAVQIRRLGRENGETINTMNNLGVVLRDEGKLEEAERVIRAAAEARSKLLGVDHPETLRTWTSLASIEILRGRPQEAKEILDTTVEAARHALGDDHPVTLYAIGIDAWALMRLGQLDEAERLRRECLAASRRVFGEDHPATLDNMSYLAWLLNRRGETDEAVSLAREALEGQRKRLGPDHPKVLEALNTLAVILNSRGDEKEALRLHRQAYEARRHVLGAENPATLASLNNMAVAELRLGRPEEAGPLFDQIIETRRRLWGEDDPGALDAQNNKGLVLVGLGEYAEAERLFTDLVARRRRVLGPDNPETISAIGNLAYALGEDGKNEEAVRYQREVLDAQVHTLGPRHPETLTTAGNLASSLLDLGRNAKAEELVRRMLPAAERPRDDAGRLLLARLQAHLGRALGGQKRYAEAEPLLQEAYENLLESGVEDPGTRDWILKLLDRLYGQWHRPERAAAWKRRQAELEKTSSTEPRLPPQPGSHQASPTKTSSESRSR